MSKYVLMLILLTFLAPVYAQDDDLRARADSLPVLEPEDVFANNVEVIETLPELNADGSNHVLYYLAADSESWEVLSPPNELLSGYLSTDSAQNGNFRVYLAPSDMAGPCPPSTPSFEFDPTTRLFTLQEAETFTPDPSSYWGIFYSSPPENIRLRNYCELNRYGAELPDDMSDIIRANIEYGVSNAAQIHIPDYLIVPAPRPNDEGIYLFAIYTVADDSWSESFPLNLSGDWTFSSLGFEDDRLYFMASGEAGRVFYTLDISTKTFEELFRSPYSQPVHSKDDFYYYIGYNDTHYQFYKYDLFAQREEVIAEIPCAALSSSCMELNIWNSNWWSDVPDLMFVLKGAETEEGISYYVVDVTNADLLYKGFLPSSSTYISWLDGKEPRFLINFYSDMPEPYTVFVDLNPDNSAETQVIIPYRVGDVSPDGQRVTVSTVNVEDSTQTIGIVDLETLAYTPVTLPLDTNVFDASIFWRTDTTLEITVYFQNPEIKWYDPLPLRTWIIRL